jgi:hypothetical protein
MPLPMVGIGSGEYSGYSGYSGYSEYAINRLPAHGSGHQGVGIVLVREPGSEHLVSAAR